MRALGAAPLSITGASPAPLQPGASEMAALSRHALELTGIRISQRNEGFLNRRLPHLVAQSGYSSLGLYLSALPADTKLCKGFVEALTIHTTSFFRKARQYEWLASDGLPELANARSALVLWSAAASTGQEGWSALFVADQVRRRCPGLFRAKLIGTDLSTKVIGEARRAVYSEAEVQGLPKDVLQRNSCAR